jgi:hypothetical protein
MPSSTAIVRNYYVAHLAWPAAVCNEILCSGRLRGSPVTERTNTIKCERPFAVRDVLPTSFVCLASFLAAGMQTATWLSAGMGRPFFLLDWPAPQGMRRSLRTAVAECARAVRSRSTSEIAAKAPSVWSTEATYLQGSTAGVLCAGRATCGLDLRRSARWSAESAQGLADCENRHVKGARAGLQALFQGGGCWCCTAYCELPFG